MLQPCIAAQSPASDPPDAEEIKLATSPHEYPKSETKNGTELEAKQQKQNVSETATASITTILDNTKLGCSCPTKVL